MSTKQEHDAVLLEEAVEALVIDPNGIYIDCTFGRGGHSRAILSHLSEEGRLIGFDKDLQAIAVGEQLQQEDARFNIVHESFSLLEQEVSKRGWVGEVTGVLMDLGVSSPQLDQAERGFSFMQDGPLDMRMDTTRGQTAEQWIANTDEEDMVWAFKAFGEERYAKRIARAIVEKRAKAPITRTKQLADIISEAHPRWEKHKHPATRCFQAIRIAVNRELDDLKDTLEQVLNVLKVGGRLVAISFHSLEDRIVKQFIQKQAQGQNFPAGLPITEDMINRRMKKVGKFTKAGDSELERNIRARSAVMRVAEKLS
ncbi:16S rRNA (cytosine(1402)-N(4))-methyltransferase RsmH [Kangiella koreensis]|uniref:Ribosomal RNA small subunit methyltransferase H n=1 Tax=Kangiella koreensis (strain DSM 16069 / JCM 12317 / KCTC 12182 / SW-125) TaxID=523791 RepID=C7R9L0_KANKD|nr:16S rRNA (cytosine(1402)-N(4))-methyltransferase RsmH [Kangiella koreensis]ACV26101.1 S-adenosyl-methyltransferase MraW [Kangiella koreensis DSM 16069]